MSFTNMIFIYKRKKIMLSILTASGGLIELGTFRDRFRGDLLYLHVDQTL